ncbi:MAG: helix-turn-helix domain-containing protein, partial [Eggerthella lenta]
MSKNEKMARKDPLVQRLSADLGSRLLEVRTSEGLSQTTLAEMVGTKHPRISNLEGGLVDVRLSDIVKLARALDVNPGELLDLAEKLDIVQKSGAWFSYNGTRIGQGRENAKKFLQD